jgi:carbon-monoxide dehydrogenase medium subunit
VDDNMKDIREYHRPKQLEEALALLSRRDVWTVPIGGGSQLIAEGRREVEAVVDLRDLNLAYVRRDGGALRVGATTTLQTMLDSSESAQAWGSELMRAVEYTAARNLREQGTLAGTLVSAAPNNPLAVLLLAIGVSLTVHAPNRRTLSLDEFFAERQILQRGALITEITIPLARTGEAVAFEKVGRTPADLPIVCAAVKARLDGGATRDVRIALGGVGASPLRATRAEQSIEQGQPPDTVANLIASEIDPPSDFTGSAEYRREMAIVLTKRAVQRLYTGSVSTAHA